LRVLRNWGKEKITWKGLNRGNAYNPGEVAPPKFANESMEKKNHHRKASRSESKASSVDQFGQKEGERKKTRTEAKRGCYDTEKRGIAARKNCWENAWEDKREGDGKKSFPRSNGEGQKTRKKYLLTVVV